MAKRNQLQEQLEGLFSDLSASAPPQVEQQVAPQPADDDVLRLFHKEAAAPTPAPDHNGPETPKFEPDLIPPDPQPVVAADAAPADSAVSVAIAPDQPDTVVARDVADVAAPQRRRVQMTAALKLFLAFLFIALVPLLIIMVFGRTPFVAAIALAVAAILSFQLIHLSGWARSTEATDVEPLATHEVEATEEILLEDQLTPADAALDGRTIELEQTIAELNRQASDLTAVAEITRAVASCLDPQEVIQVAVDTMQTRFGLYNVSIYLSDDEGASTVAGASSGEAAQEIVSLPQRWSAEDDGLVGAVCADGQAHHSSITQRTSNALLPKSSAELALPLCAGGRMLGVLDVHTTETKTLGDADIHNYGDIADTVALSLHNARQYAEKKRQALHRELAARLSDRVARESELVDVATVVLKELGTRFELNQATICLGTEAELMVAGNGQKKGEP